MGHDDQLNSKKRPSIFQYSDYRAFLRDHFAYMKATNASYSFRTFSRLAGFNSPNFLQLVYDGKRIGMCKVHREKFKEAKLAGTQIAMLDQAGIKKIINHGLTRIFTD
jgi:hypothetical protein